MEQELAARVANIQRELETASASWGRVPKLIAVSKTVPAERIAPLANLGVFNLGENRVHEILQKKPDLDPKFRFHLIGRLQTNKVKYIINQVCLIHSLDRVELAQEIHRQALKAGKVMDVLVQVNFAGESQKAGLPPESVLSFVKACADLEGLRVRGLMAIMPLEQDAEKLRPYFRGMRQLFDNLIREEIPGVFMEELSMGMSQDYRVAAQEGATMVRIGSALFGSRSYAPAVINN